MCVSVHNAEWDSTVSFRNVHRQTNKQDGINMRPQDRTILLATEPGISLIILTLMKILQRNLNRNMFVVWEMWRHQNLLLFKFRCNIFISVRIIKEMTGSVASGTACIIVQSCGLMLIQSCLCVCVCVCQCTLRNETVDSHSALCTDTHTNRTGLTWGHKTERF